MSASDGAITDSDSVSAVERFVIDMSPATHHTAQLGYRPGRVAGGSAQSKTAKSLGSWLKQLGRRLGPSDQDGMEVI